MITEGPIDSLFLDNAVALAGADADIKINHEQCTMIFDNEPRNQEIVNRMIKAVDKKFNLVVVLHRDRRLIWNRWNILYCCH